MKMPKVSHPLVSIVIPVYNTQEFVAESVESILQQSYPYFELLIVNDGSTDNSLSILKKLASKDKRIKLFSNHTNQGVTNAVKKALRFRRGYLLARMDADDIAPLDRIEKQVSYLTSHAETIAVSGQCLLINRQGNIIGQKSFPLDHTSIYRSMATFMSFQQGASMIDLRKLPKNFPLYKSDLRTSEEVELIFRLFRYGKLQNLPDILLNYRLHTHNTSFQDIRKTFYSTLFARIKGVFLHGYRPTIRDIAINIIQLFCVTLLPQKITLALYHATRKTAVNQHKPTFHSQSLYAKLFHHQ